METEMQSEMDKAPNPPVAAIIYGEITYWIAIIGLIITMVGIAIYLAFGGYLDKAAITRDIWRGDTVRTIWKDSAGVAEVPRGYWYLGKLAKGDCLAMLGIAVACIAAVVGMWGAFFGLLRSKGGIYIIFSLLIAAILTLSASGIISI